MDEYEKRVQENPFNDDTLEILPDLSLKINGVSTKANILSIKPIGTRGKFRVKLELNVLLTAAPPSYDIKELEATGQVVIKSCL